ncbi:MAG: hypothetical protein ABSH28_00850 [Acidobacteriota bacterium]
MNYYNYFTEIEEHFVRRRGKHLWVSPMDWSLIATWRDSGVPLHVVLRGIDRAMDGFFAKRSRINSKINTLFYCHASVMDEYAQHLESHLGEHPMEGADTAVSAAQKPDGPDKETILEFLNARISEIRVLVAKLSVSEGGPEGMERIVRRLEEIIGDLETDNQVDFEALDRDLGILDETLVGELRTAVSLEQITAWEQEAKKELKIYRKKLPKDIYGKILENFMRTKVHRHFTVGELSLFHL